jgi:hypothetical protein
VSQWAGPADAPDRYELIQLHSRGGEGELWRGAIDPDGVAIPVAVKVLHPGPDERAQEAADRVQRQAELLRTLDHPSLVTVREAFAGPPVHPQAEADPAQRALYLDVTDHVARSAHDDVQEGAVGEDHRAMASLPLEVFDALTAQLPASARSQVDLA